MHLTGNSFLDKCAYIPGVFLKGLSPGLYRILASFYYPLLGSLMAWRTPSLTRRAPKIVLIGGEEGPDKISTYFALFDLYPVLAKKFDVTLMMRPAIRERHLRKIAELDPDLVLPSFDSGWVQKRLESMDIPLMGSSSTICRKCFDKFEAKKLAGMAGIRVPGTLAIEKRGDELNPPGSLAYPIVVKPRRGGSSQGVSKVDHAGELAAALKAGFRWDEEVLLEEFIRGREYTCTVFGNDRPQTLPVMRKIMKFELEEFEARGEKVLKHRFPELTGEGCLHEIAEQSKAIYRVIGCRDMVRIDWKYDDEKKRLCFLEINTLPWIGKKGGNIWESAEAAGSSYEGFIMNLFTDALHRIGRKA